MGVKGKALMDQDTDAIAQIDAALAVVAEGAERSQYDDLGDLGATELARISTMLYATIVRLTPAHSPHRQSADKITLKYDVDHSFHIQPLSGILLALKADYEAGYTRSVEEDLNATIFADFLEMADRLLSESHKDAAAVIAGAVLEEHLRKLALRNDVPAKDDAGRPTKADRLNADLRKADSYPALDEKSVAAWLDLRNKAAHAQYDDYRAEQVSLFIQGLRDFITRHPA